MVNKVLAAFLVMDGLFVSMGAIMLGFCVIVRQTAFDVPTEGREAARDLLYRTFPFNGKNTPPPVVSLARKVTGEVADHPDEQLVSQMPSSRSLPS